MSEISREDREAALNLAWGAGVSGAWKCVAEMYREGKDVRAWADGLTPRDIAAELRETRRLLQLDEQALVEPCVWTREEDDIEGPSWVSSCGARWCFTDGDPAENHITFCHGCGRRLQVAVHQADGTGTP